MSITLARVVILGGGPVLPISGYASAVTLTTNDYTAVINATAGPVTVSLPPVISTPGRIFIVKKGDATANSVIIAPNGTDTIDGAALYFLITLNDVVGIQSDGNHVWHVIFCCITPVEPPPPPMIAPPPP